MSTEKDTLESLSQAYAGMCSKAGHLAYQIYVYNEELATLHRDMRDVNMKAAALKAKAEDKKDESKN